MLCSRNLLGIPLRKLGEDVKGTFRGDSAQGVSTACLFSFSLNDPARYSLSQCSHTQIQC